ncbi:hypothetical protein FB550_11829 [Neobacillus bataviensis]|uniref:Uncharacterized protein n=1 Tax=Neobacillus bataviensis TaxID=220685 RepID=A0A561CNI5_9BACI|nr:DUF6270 domain-containing protein [Neobacillus bataviensis]TWD92398.1 hypothetical protein FB550_11829 [Neobacillus bataviensis]
MQFTIHHVNFTEKKTEINFNLDTDCDQDIYVSLRLRDKDIWYSIEYKDEALVKTTKDNNNYFVEFDHQVFLKQFTCLVGKKNIVDVHLKIADQYYVLKPSFDSEEFNENHEYKPLNTLAKLKPYITKGNKLAYKISAVDVKPSLGMINDSEQKVVFSIKPIRENRFFPTKLFIGERFHDSLPVYKRTIELLGNSGQYILNKCSVNGLDLNSEEQKLEMVAQYSEDNILINSTVQVDTNFESPLIKIDNFCNLKLGKSEKNILAISIKKEKINVTIKEVQTDNNLVEMNLELDSKIASENVDNIKLAFYKETKNGKKGEYFKFHELDYTKLEENMVRVNFELYQLFNEVNINNAQSLKLFISFVYNHNHYFEKVKLENPIEHKVGVGSLNLKLHGEKTLTLNVVRKQLNPYKIAILGSCYSRSAFNSQKKYFNPDYKNYFEIVYTNFQPSIISMSSDPIEFAEDKFSDLDPADLLNVQREFEKTVFEDLEEHAPDYVIIDFFVDATHGVIKLDDNKLIGLNSSVKRSKYYRNHLATTTYSIHNRKPEFFKMWEEACIKFIEKITKIIPPHKIILNNGGLIDKFFDKNNDIQSFIKKGEISKSEYEHFNSVWSYMNNFFLSNLPEAQFIDLRPYNFIGSYDHPVSPGPHHYESGYYKKYIDELRRIIMFNERSL